MSTISPAKVKSTKHTWHRVHWIVECCKAYPEGGQIPGLAWNLGGYTSYSRRARFHITDRITEYYGITRKLRTNMTCLVTLLANVMSYGRDTSRRSMVLLDCKVTVMEHVTCDVTVITNTHQTHTTHVRTATRPTPSQLSPLTTDPTTPWPKQPWDFPRPLLGNKSDNPPETTPSLARLYR